MYMINNIIDGKVYRLHDQRDRQLRVINPHLILTMNKTGDLEFRIPPSHVYYHTIKKLTSIIQLIEDGELIFEGRPVFEDTDFHNVKKFSCEGSMAYLIDSIQRPYSIVGNIHDFLDEMIKRHNEQVEERKKFVLGRVNVVDENNEIKRECASLENTWNTLNKQLVDVHGGCLWVEYREDRRYLNYTYDYGGRNEQQIRFGVNLLDLTRYQDATTVVTCMIPYGAVVEYRDALGETQTRTVDITSVNNGKDHIMADQAVLDMYGQIWGTYQWPDITDPGRLLEKAREYLKETGGIPDTLKVSAVDLNYTGVDIRRFHVGYYTTAVSKPHGISKDLLLARLEIYLDDPGKGSISLGSTVETFTSATVNKQVNLSKALQESEAKTYDEMARKITNATNLITGGFGGYVVLDSTDPATGKKIHPWRILVMNTPDKATAKNIIQINQNGIGFSTTGIKGPYRNAWTIDGNLVADFITAGTMLADRVRGGTLELGGSGIGRDGRILVKDSSDRTIGYWDKTGMHVMMGVIDGSTIRGSSIIGGMIDIGNGLLYAADDEAWLGDYRISANGTNELVSTNGFVRIDCRAAEPNWPIGKYATLFLGGDGSNGVKINGGTGRIECGDINCGDVHARDCKLAEGSTRRWGLGETIDWFWGEFEALRNRVDSL